MLNSIRRLIRPFVRSIGRTPCFFVVVHCPDADSAAIVARVFNAGVPSLSRHDPPRIMRGGERLGKRGECF